MRLFTLLGKILIGIGLAIILCLPAAAGEPAQMRAAGEGLEWEVSAASSPHQLTVGGDGLEIRRLFPAGRPPSMPLFDAAGQPLPDGIYTWSLESLPPAIESAWDPANGRDQRRVSPPPPDPMPTAISQTGYFLVRGGRLVALEEGEPAAGAARSDNDPSTAGQ